MGWYPYAFGLVFLFGAGVAIACLVTGTQRVAGWTLLVLSLVVPVTLPTYMYGLSGLSPSDFWKSPGLVLGFFGLSLFMSVCVLPLAGVLAAALAKRGSAPTGRPTSAST